MPIGSEEPVEREVRWRGTIPPLEPPMEKGECLLLAEGLVAWRTYSLREGNPNHGQEKSSTG
jgi:hypothetical protein